MRKIKEKLAETEKELENERFRQVDLNVVVARNPKPQEQHEELVHEAGGAQFASITRKESESEFLLEKKAKEKEAAEKEARDLVELGMELEELEGAQRSAPLLVHNDLKYSIPKTPEALRAKQKRNCITCV